MHELPPFHVPPLVIGTMACTRIVRTAAAWFAADFHAPQEGP
jgi:hypothetical protein